MNSNEYLMNMVDLMKELLCFKCNATLEACQQCKYCCTTDSINNFKGDEDRTDYSKLCDALHGRS
jgi:hypothetical protein